MRGKKPRIALILTVFTVAFVLGLGCTSRFQKKTPTDVTKPKEDKGPAALYYDFSDILIPGELKIDRSLSFVYQTSGFTAGMLALDGQVDSDSLANFFSSNMTKDNWRLISSIKAARTMMLFEKENRWCVISITGKELFSTEVEIWVAPTLDSARPSRFQ